MDQDRNIAMKDAAGIALRRAIDSAAASAFCGQRVLVLSFQHGQLRKAELATQSSLGSVVDNGEGPQEKWR